MVLSTLGFITATSTSTSAERERDTTERKERQRIERQGLEGQSRAKEGEHSEFSSLNGSLPTIRMITLTEAKRDNADRSKGAETESQKTQREER